MQLPSRSSTNLHEFTYTLLSKFVNMVGDRSFADIIFNADDFIGAVRLSGSYYADPFLSLKELDNDAMKRLEGICSKIILKMFEMSESRFIPNVTGTFEQKFLLFSNTGEFSDMFLGVIHERMVQWNLYMSLQGFFVASLQKLMLARNDLWKKVTLSEKQAVHEVQKYGGWALNGMLKLKKSDAVRQKALRCMYSLAHETPHNTVDGKLVVSSITSIENQGGLKLLKPQFVKWVDAILQHIRCFINDDSILHYRAKTLHYAKEDLEKKCKDEYNAMFCYAWGKTFEDDPQMHQNYELMKIVRNNLVNKIFNARSKEALHPFLERNCGRSGQQQTMPIRNKLKLISGSGKPDVSRKSNESAAADEDFVHHDDHDKDKCEPPALDEQSVAILLNADLNMPRFHEDVKDVSFQEHNTSKRRKMTKEAQKRLGDQRTVMDRFNDEKRLVPRRLEEEFKQQ